MFIAALFIIAKIQKQHKDPSTDEWIKKMCVCELYILIYVCAYGFCVSKKGSEGEKRRETSDISPVYFSSEFPVFDTRQVSIAL